MSLLDHRRKHGAICPKCKHPDYSMTKPVPGITTKTTFRCMSCGHSWSYGKDGGKYAVYFRMDGVMNNEKY